MKNYFSIILTVLVCLFLTNAVSAQIEKELQGRWDLVVSKDGKQLPSWLEVYKSGNSTLVGRFVYAFGSARPVAHLMVKNGTFRFSIPPQWEEGDRYMDFEGQMVGSELKGTMIYSDGKKYDWKGTRAPLLHSIENPIWGAPRALFNDKDLTGWHADRENQWVVQSYLHYRRS